MNMLLIMTQQQHIIIIIISTIIIIIIVFSTIIIDTYNPVSNSNPVLIVSNPGFWGALALWLFSYLRILIESLEES